MILSFVLVALVYLLLKFRIVSFFPFIYARRVYTSNKGRPIRYIIIHGTGMKSEEQVINHFRDKDAEVSSHYLIGEDGKIVQFVRDSEIAWHAGKSKWKNERSLNFSSIGIELFNKSAGKCDAYTDRQYVVLISLLTHLVNKYKILPKNILGHSDVAPNRKTDPGECFDWDRLFRKNLCGQLESRSSFNGLEKVRDE